MFFCQFFEKRMSVREGNLKVLLETVTYITITETVTSMITIETIVCIMQKIPPAWFARGTRTCIIAIKIVTHILTAETITCISAAETFNYIIATKTITCMIATERSTNMAVTESTTSMIAIEPQNLHNCNRHCLWHNCYRQQKVSVT